MHPLCRSLLLLSLLGAFRTPVAAPCPEPPADAPALTFDRVAVEIESATGTHRFDLEVAASLEQKGRGLMYRKTLPPTAGMLFDYGRPRLIAMWMKNTCISLDMLFYRPDGRISHIIHRTEPFSTRILSSRVPAQGVIELGGGTAQALGIAVGDRVGHPLLGAPSP
jgi:uncharacterized membrane protein (UPF0127 family)